MLALLCFYFSLYILFGPGKIVNIKFDLILSTKTFKFKPTIKKIAYIHIRILCICHPVFDFSISISNSQHSMLGFHK